MNRILKFVLYYYLVAITISLIVFAFFHMRDNDIARANTLKKEARKSYQQADYQDAFNDLQILLDSAGVSHDAVRLNFAHAGFMLSKADSTGFVKNHFNKNETIDSTEQTVNKKQIGLVNSLNHYLQLGENASDKRIASLAHNQLGITSYLFRDVEQLEKEEAALAQAAEYFKQALKKDPQNQFARYNYELIRKKIHYSEMIMSQVQSLIRERKYKEARTLLRKAIERDDLIEKKYSDYVQRIETIIQIDSVSRS